MLRAVDVVPAVVDGDVMFIFIDDCDKFSSRFGFYLILQ